MLSEKSCICSRLPAKALLHPCVSSLLDQVLAGEGMSPLSTMLSVAKPGEDHT